jgi:hypothetical protein
MRINNCPFCGSEAHCIQLCCDEFFACCDSVRCFTRGPRKQNKESAIAAWNRIRVESEEK